MKIKLVSFFSILSFSSTVLAINNNTYSEITRMSSWIADNDIYLTEPHVCDGTAKDLYKLSKSDTQQYSLLLTAFSAGFKVRLSYKCDSNGYPKIVGVRVQK